MRYAIINSSGNVLEWFEDEASARAAMDEMLTEAPEAADHVDLMALPSHGRELTILGALDRREAIVPVSILNAGPYPWPVASQTLGNFGLIEVIKDGKTVKWRNGRAETDSNDTDARVPSKTPA